MGPRRDKTPASAEALRDRVLVAALPHVAERGWSEHALKAGARDAGLEAGDGIRAFPYGMLDAVEHFADWADRKMLSALEEQDLIAMRLRERIQMAIRLRLDILVPHREAVRRGLAFSALPGNGGARVAATWRTVDAIWHAAGDRSVDFSYYTKRATLAGVYAMTVLYWLNDASEGQEDTRAFLARRIGEVMAFGRFRGRVSDVARGLSRFGPREILDFSARLFSRG